MNALQSSNHLLCTYNYERMPLSKTGCLTMASPLFSLAWKHLHVISSDRMPDGKLRVVVMSNHANKIAEYASRMFSIFQDKRLMIEINFVEQKDGCNSGHVGISDYKKVLAIRSFIHHGWT